MRDGVLVQVGTPEEIVLNPADDYVRRFAVEAPRAKVVRAATIAQALPELPAELPVDAALTALAQNGGGSALVRPDARAPFVITAQDLLKSDGSSRTLGSLQLRTSTVTGDELLASVMQKLIDTGRPVLVESPPGGFLGAIDDSLAVRALSVQSSS
jgi:glycine betaine/proline transport system ATP-binding protein